MAHVFGAWDWVILVITIVASAGIGLYYRFSGGRQKTNDEYLLGDRNMAIFPVAVSLMAAFLSSISLLGNSAENYGLGAIYFVINIGYGIGTPIATQLYLPVFFGLQKTSAYEYLELRFGPKIRVIASLTYTLQMVLYNGIVLYAPAIVLESVTGLDRLVSIFVVGLACTFYATLGGMKAVIITDLLQSLMMFVAVLIVLVYATIQVGSIGEVMEIAQQSGRLDFSNINPDPTDRHTWWSLAIGGMFIYLSLYAVNQTQVQRLLTVSTLQRSQLCLWVSWPVLSVLSFTTCMSGIAMYAFYKDCDPYSAGFINGRDQLLPYFVVDAMGEIPGMVGLFVAGIFSASLSTLSSACNSLAAVTMTDYVGRWITIRPSLQNIFTKIAACGYGLLFVAMAFVAENLGGVLQAALTIFGVVGGPLLGVFTLGMFTTYANENGVSLGLISGIAFTMWMNFGGPRPPLSYLPVSVSECPGNVTLPVVDPIEPSDYFYLYRISYIWTSPIGFLWVVIVGSVVSLLWRARQPWQRADGGGEPDPALFTPPLAARMRRRQQEKSLIKPATTQAT